MAKKIFDWVPEELVLPVTQAAAEVYRRHGNRRVRALARLKIVVDQMGAEGFGRKVIEVLEERGVAGVDRLEFAKGPANILPAFVDGQPVIAQRQKGFNTVRVIVPRGELGAKGAARFAAWARAYGDGSLQFTARQNLQIRFVPDARVDALVREIHAAGYDTEGFERVPDMVACVGTTQCNLAVSDTPNTYHRLYAELYADKALWS